MAESVRKLLIVEDDPGLQKQLKWCFEDYDVCTAENRQAAIAELRRHEPAVILQDLGLPPQPEGVEEGFATLTETLRLAPHTKVIVVTGNGDQENALTAVAQGAYDFYEKPVDTDTLKLLVDRAFNIYELEAENRRLHNQVADSPLDGIVAASDGMLAVCRMIEKIAPTDVTTLLLGESGTGKELLARALHRLSSREDGNFVAINCAAIPENLLESELFGYEKGAFTGAHKQTVGKVEVANGGTLFLDEIGDMPMALQAKMLRFLQERVIERVGGRKEIPVDVRVVCATNQNPENLIAEGLFREDLFYRVSEITINIPPYREREEGRLILARTLLQRFAKLQNSAINGFSDDAMQAIETYSWPGNVRELENKIKGAVIMADGKMVTAADLGLDGSDAEGESLNLREVRQVAESKAIRVALTRSYGNISKAAELLGITRPTLYDLLNKYGLSADSYSKKAAS
ncbi:MAG: PEP-CTERM-box response regulator transcription factor [Gammaproteobacteria bacterium]|nr:PEP-CTERM-box response regulator transcription factor [Gammaproteobacteria bacterium]NNF49779.1 PEP-CTERM-box response regulator transcription factor [Woeseiaceae bacterium]MBT8094158.1 PEP-CTERM-box response regulator transcription factor [Gammaproteobacteria bacterium]MBT8104547.1 PEP-CTERM-box response regulator transcription factor [Gammaproteobacteria bacterium]NNK24561.1 PEP-CTERM-box response regulator transcription factor [Woeseiaceae bacterium]